MKPLCMLLPTNEPNTMKNILMSEESLKSLAELSDLIIIALNFQSPYNNETIKYVLDKFDEYGIEYRYTFNTYEVKQKGFVPFNKIRNDCYELYPNAEYYFLLDDDMQFHEGSSLQVLQAIDYMDRYSNCGLVQLKSKFFGVKSVLKNIIAPDKIYGAYKTDNGILFRAMNKEIGVIYPNDAVDNVGAGEENIIAAHRMSRGYYPAHMKCDTITHYANHNIYNVRSGLIDYEWHIPEVVLSEHGNHKYLQTHFNKHLADNCSFNSFCVVNPIGLSYKYIFGSDIRLVYNYNNCSYEQLLYNVKSRRCIDGA